MPSPVRPVPVPHRVGPDPDDTRWYADAETGVYETWRSRGSARGVTVALVHGGFWKAAYDRTHLRPLAGALAEDGFHVASVEYPRVGMPGGGWPGTCDSVAAALRAVVADPDLPGPVVAAGHSAGGHLVAWCASSSSPRRVGVSSPLPKPEIEPEPESHPRVPGLAGIVPLAGVLDLALADELALGDQAVRGLLGRPRDEPTGGIPDEADPGRQRLLVPAVLIHGTADTNVPLSVSQSYLARRTPDDAPCRLLTLPGADHFAVVDPLDEAYEHLKGAVGDLTAAARPAGT